MYNKDFNRVMEIDGSSGGDYTWKTDDLLDEWKDYNGVGIVAVDNHDVVLGFCIYSLCNKDCFEIKHMVIDKEFRRSGIGTSIINRMKGKLNDRRYILGCNVDEENLSFQLFLKKMDFKANLIRHSFGDEFRFQYEKE
jgi:ribosomal protein S18 acetylase RimI-like enzyme